MTADIRKAAIDIVTGMPEPNDEGAKEQQDEEGLNIATEEMMEAFRANDIESFKSALKSFLDQWR